MPDYDTAIEAIVALSGAPALSYTIVQHGKPIQTRHLGYRNVEALIKPNDDTIYGINSMTKAMVAALAAIIASQGLIDLDDPVAKHLPDFKCLDPELTEKVTIADFLSHRSGLANNNRWSGTFDELTISKADALAVLATAQTAMPLRAGFKYNNWGYEVVGQLLEHVTGESFADLLGKYLFIPLGMSRSSTRHDPDDDNTVSSYGVLSDKSAFPQQHTQMAPGTIMEAAGAMRTTITDLIKLYTSFLHALRHQTETGSNSTPGSPFINTRALTAAQIPWPGSFPHEQSYAFGWARTCLPGQLGLSSINSSLCDPAEPSTAVIPIIGAGTNTLAIHHNGSMGASTSCVILLPEHDAFVVALCNAMTPVDVPDLACEHLVQAFLGCEEQNDFVALTRTLFGRGVGYMDKIKAELESKRIKGTKPKDLDEYTGTYLDRSGILSIVVAQKSDGLVIMRNGQEDDQVSLTHYQNDSFTAWRSFDELMKGALMFPEPAEYYVYKFGCNGDGGWIDEVRWRRDSDVPDVVYTKKN